MFSKFFSLSFLVLGLVLHVNAHAIILPALGVQGDATRDDVKTPSKSNPCGAGVDIATDLANAQTVTAATDGSFTVTVQSFNGQADGSRKVSAQVDPAATGDNFDTKVDITTNGDPDPADAGSEQVTAQLPSGTQCTGGDGGDTCLVQFKTTANFGSCVAVKQGAGGAAGGGADPADPAATNGTATDDGSDNADPKPKKKGGKKNDARGDIDVRAVGTRAARAFRRESEGTFMLKF